MEIVDFRRIKPPDEIGKVKRRFLFPVLAPLAGAYSAASWLWRRLPAKASDPGVPVISVGSISVGGTGKTPLCIHIARKFARQALKVCILSRGYRRKSRRSPLAVSDGKRILATLEEAGDEPFMMAKRLPDVGVVVGKDRVRAARSARGLMDPDLLVLDDGFQYRHILKRAEIVCMDRASLSQGDHTLPLGTLREGFSSIKPTHIMVISSKHGDGEGVIDDFKRHGSQRVFFASQSQPTFSDADGRPVEAQSLQTEGVAILSAIARPGGFENTCLAAGINAAVSIRFEDHHWYTPRDVEKTRAIMGRYGCSILATTEKDIHKLPADLRRFAAVVRVDIEIDDEDRFWEILNAAIEVE
jgi:tetraacyldisaccharide 4'-kinase